MTTGHAGPFLPGNAINPNDIDLTAVQHDFERHVEQILAGWSDITRSQIADIVSQVEQSVSSGDVRRLAKMSVSTKDAELALLETMTSLALSAAQRVVDEVADQGRNIDPVASDTAPFKLIASATAILLGGALANAAGREALRLWSPGADATDVSRGVQDHLDSLSDSFLTDTLGGALSHAETTGRANTLLAAPSMAIYGSEVLDHATCGPCREINGKWITNSDDPQAQAKIDAIYPRGYVGCLGRDRCRGQIVGVVREQGEGFVGAEVTGVLARTYKRDSAGRFGSGGGQEVRSALAAAKSIGELNAGARAEIKRITGRDIEFDMTGSDLGTAKEHSEGIMQGLERFPATKLDSVRVARLADNAYAHAAGNEIVFNSTHAGNRAAYLKSLTSDAAGWEAGLQTYGISDQKIAGFHVRNSGTPVSVAVHEFGHVLDMATTYERTKYDVDALTTRLTDREKRSPKLPGTPVRDSADFVQRSVSSYARQGGRRELVAEAFTDVMINGSGASELSTGIYALLEGEYNA